MPPASEPVTQPAVQRENGLPADGDALIAHQTQLMDAKPPSVAAAAKRPTVSDAMLGLTQLPNYLTLKGSFSAVSKPHFASKYALESSRRDHEVL